MDGTNCASDRFAASSAPDPLFISCSEIPEMGPVSTSPSQLAFGFFYKRQEERTFSGSDVLPLASFCSYTGPPMVHVKTPSTTHPHQTPVAQAHRVWESPEGAFSALAHLHPGSVSPTCNCGQVWLGVTQQTSLPSTPSSIQSKFQAPCPFLG